MSRVVGPVLLAMALLGNACWPPRSPTPEEKARVLELAACVARRGCGSHDLQCTADALEMCTAPDALANAGAGGA